MIFNKRKVVTEIPDAFKCDICGKVVELKENIDFLLRPNVADNMAVIQYSLLGEKGIEIRRELHCCSTSCIATAIDKYVSFGATITIPYSRVAFNRDVIEENNVFSQLKEAIVDPTMGET